MKPPAGKELVKMAGGQPLFSFDLLVNSELLISKTNQQSVTLVIDIL